MNNKITNHPRGSEWRKWDLHFHTPSSYDYQDKSVTNKVLIKTLKDNGIRAIAVTDHNTIDVTRIADLQNEAGKDLVVFPGIELCTDSRGDDPIHITAVFPENSDTSYIWKELEVKLNISKQINDGKKINEIYCRLPEASKEIHALGGIVLIHAGSKSNSIEVITNSLPVKMAEKKDIAEFVDVFEMGQEKDGQEYKEKVFPSIKKVYPMVICSDNHNINKYELKQNLWVKADLTFEGLRQILIEPEDRVCICATKPDEKESYKVIDKVNFKDAKEFPSEIEFNGNLCSVIGSRSSGKSSLLNYIAHAVNKSEVEKLLTGPAAKIYWRDLSLSCSVTWADGSKDDAGKVVFLPQGYLSGISDKPEVITEKIKPVLFRKYPKVEASYNATLNSITSCNKSLETSIQNWFSSKNSIQIIRDEIKLIGDKKAIELAKDGYQKKIDEIKGTLSLTDKDIKDFQKVSASISQLEGILTNLNLQNTNLISEYFASPNKQVVDIKIDYSFNPSLNNLPSELKVDIESDLSKSSEAIVTKIKATIAKYRDELSRKIKEISGEIETLKIDNKTLIEKNKQNEQLSKLVELYNKQNNLLTLIKTKEDSIKGKEKKTEDELLSISANLISRSKAIQELKDSFSEIKQSGNRIEFGVECSFDFAAVTHLSEKFNLKETKGNDFIKDGVIDILKARELYKDFLINIYSKTIKLKTYENPQSVAIQTLSFVEEIRFTAIMEDDSIGGFSESSMTPGKQALFALTLILDESGDAWPLLIDQPEDDLDSRSIYDQIAAYFKDKKRGRQIIMVSHNANLVVGADSEQIIIANKHGDDRKNDSNQMFNYLSGAIENTVSRNTSDIVLESCGIREHACDILDGGEEAFRKRELKYKLKAR